LVLMATGLASGCGEPAADPDGRGNGPATVRPAASGPPRLGAPAPAYEIPTLDGALLRIGPSPSVVLLNVWATWCTACKEEFARLDTLLSRHSADGLRVVAVSVDAAETEVVRRTLEAHGATFEGAHDPRGTIEARFPALGVPASYVIDRDGILRWRHVGVLPPDVDSVVASLLSPARPGAPPATLAPPTRAQ
jgi:cytochrome c biogenesis protein CcmG/thiol:disulfide interchange protein DsbE